MNNLHLKFIFLFLLFSQISFSQTAKEWLEKGKNAYNNERYESAIEYCTKAIELNYSLLAGAYSNRGNAKNCLGKYKDAIIDLDKAIELEPKFAMPYNNKGYSLIKLDKRTKAIACFNKAILLDPNYIEAYYNRGNYKNIIGQYDSAIIDFSKAISLAPNCVAAYQNRGLSKFSLRKYKEAIADFKEVLRYDPHNFAVKVAIEMANTELDEQQKQNK